MGSIYPALVRSEPLPQLHTAPIVPPANPLEQYGEIMGIKNAQQEQQARAQQMQTGAIEQQGAELQLQQQQQEQRDQQAFRAAMQEPGNQGKTISDIADSLADKGSISPQSWVSMKKADLEQRTALAGLDKAQLDNAAAAHKQTQELYNNLMAMSPEELAQNWPEAARQYDAIPGQKVPLDPNQPMTREQLQQFGPMLSMHQAYLDQAIARQKAQADLQTSQANLGKTEAETDFYKQNGGAPGVPVAAMEMADWMKKNPGKGPSDYYAWAQRQSPYAAVMNENLLAGADNAQGLDFSANLYRNTGQLPSMAYRSPATATAIINRAAQMDEADGGSGAAANKALLQVNTHSLEGLQKNYDQVQAFEGTAQKNMEMLQGLVKNIPDLGMRWANVPVRMITDRMLGTKEMAQFQTALTSVQNESARILNSPSAAGMLTDSARNELQQVISGNATTSALLGTMQTLQQEFGNRTTAYQAQIRDIQRRIQGAGTVQQTSENGTTQAGRRTSGISVGGGVSTQPATIVQHSPSTGQYRYSTDGGKTWQSGQPK